MTATILAQNGEQGGNALVSLLPFLLLIVLFYFVLIRPQRRRMQQHAELVRSVELGDEIETVGGLFGHVRRLSDEALWIEVDAGTTIKISRAAVRRKVMPEPPATPEVGGE